MHVLTAERSTTIAERRIDVRLRCPHCQRTLEVPDSAAGKQVRCPACSATTRAPELHANEDSPASDAGVAASERKPLYSSPPASSPLSSQKPREPAVEHDPQNKDRERIACPKCAKMLLVTPALANQIVACPACHCRLRMPSMADASRGVPAKMAFGVGLGAEVREATTTSADPAGARPAEGSAPAGWPSSAWGETSPPPAVPHGAGAAGYPYTTAVGTASGPVAPPATGRSDPILYILPGSFQLAVAAIVFIITIVGLVGTINEFVNVGLANNPDAIWSLLFVATSLLTTSIVIVGSIQMIRRRSLGLARAASILAILPCNVCCGVPLIPFGIWSTVMLFLPNAPNDFR